MPVYWLIEQHAITWTEAHQMRLIDVEKLMHYHIASLSARRRHEINRAA